jgi:hypothetical protein
MYLPMLGNAVAEVEVDETLLRNPCVAGHVLKVLNDVFR